MITENLSTLKIHKLTRAQYDRELANGTIDENALYLTPDEEIDLSGYATVEALETKADAEHTHDDLYYTETEIDVKLSGKSDTSHNHDSDYDSLGSASSALSEAKSYADAVGTTIKNDLLNGAGSAYDTLKELGDLIDDNTDAIEALETMATGKADAEHTHAISDVTDLQTTLDGKAANTEATQSTSGLLSTEDKIQLDYGGIPIVSAASDDGATYTATVDGMNELKVGMKVTIIPAIVSSTTAPKLNVNSLGAKIIRMPISYNTSLTGAGPTTTWLIANKPVTVQYDGLYWVTVDLTRASAQYLYGDVPVTSGGTGVDSVTAGSFLVGNGEEAMVEKTPDEVLELIGGASTTYVDIRVPAWTSDDEGKFLRIVNGTPTWATVANAEEASF